VATLLSADADELDRAALAGEERLQRELEVYLVPRVDLLTDDRKLIGIRLEVFAHEDAKLRVGVRFRLHRCVKEAREDLAELAQLILHGPHATSRSGDLGDAVSGVAPTARRPPGWAWRASPAHCSRLSPDEAG